MVRVNTGGLKDLQNVLRGPLGGSIRVTICLKSPKPLNPKPLRVYVSSLSYRRRGFGACVSAHHAARNLEMFGVARIWQNVGMFTPSPQP